MNDVLRKALERLKSPKLLMLAGLTGILLIYLSTLFGAKSDAGTKRPAAEELSAAEYRAELEERLRGMVAQITGSRNVTVVVTLETGLRYSYADTREGTSANKTESGFESTSSESKESYITVKTSDGGEQALLVTTQMPEVRGIAIVCEGGDDEQISEKIQNAVMAALNVTSKRVYIAGGNFDEKR